ncbi:hypothetical protein TNCV_4959301 [Trichonephila clavipes]|uniref:Transposase Tc1-like domain-containing protein n=1 Tax=Trichonephila clavipes TaxID=2585209 RepID=A0A8X6SLL7_TRICX|nr:hypothetical protein TNCV_4959301 [Trichonephila clavipes]
MGQDNRTSRRRIFLSRNKSSYASEKLLSYANLEAVDHRAPTTQKTGVNKWMSASSDRYLLRMVVNERTASSRQLTARWSIATGVLMSASSIRQRLLQRGYTFIQDPSHAKPSMAASAKGS